jgi:hypothetical protein
MSTVFSVFLFIAFADPRKEWQLTPWNRETALAFLRFFMGTAAGSVLKVFFALQALIAYRNDCIPWWSRLIILHHYEHYGIKAFPSIKYPQRISVSS